MKNKDIKNSIGLLAIICSTLLNAQIGIETTTIRGSGIMDFPIGSDKGIIIPIINSNRNPNPSPGTIMMYQNIIVGFTNSGSVNFTDVGNTSSVSFNASTPPPVGVNDVIIGSGSSPASGGALVLESPNKALILPSVSNVVNMPNPYPGTICYDQNSKSFALFDGQVWSFWK
ncbi:hypothetical protein [Chryseobacterium sp. c4a]|uniref:hypothetical protein n=1 Tax=Chryseobacterium sp. c4a TaxID=1573582 RepID=UPI001359DDF0|nr:hypothetical protein [Chryseobacterium sp. c4a]